MHVSAFAEKTPPPSADEEGQALLHREEFVKAAAYFQDALKTQPQNPALWHVFAKALLGNNDHAGAINAASRAIELDPQSSPIHATLAMAYLKANNAQQAVAHMSKALAANPANAYALGIQGVLFLLQQKPAEAEACFRKAITSDATVAEPYINYAKLLAGDGRKAEAIDKLKKGVELRPYFKPAQAMLAEMYIAEERFGEAIEVLDTLLRDQPNDAALLNNLASCYVKQGNADKARACLEKAISLQPDDLQLQINLAMALIDECLPLKAMALCNDLLAKHPQHATLLFTKAIAMQQLGDLEGCKEALHRCKPELGHDPRYLLALHGVLLDEQDMQACIAPLLSAVNSPQANAAHFTYLAFAYLISGEEAEAEQAIARLDPDCGYASSFRFVQKHRTANTRFFPTTRQTLLYALKRSPESGLVMEFGVRNGMSINMIAEATDAAIHGFDSFEGLPEGWGDHIIPGGYSTVGTLPEVPEHVSLHVGWFEETLPEFLKSHHEPVRFINIDCDIYSSTKTIFTHLHDRIQAGTVLVFDEYLMNKDWQNDEHKAFMEAVNDYGWGYEFIAFSPYTKQAVAHIIRV